MGAGKTSSIVEVNHRSSASGFRSPVYSEGSRGRTCGQQIKSLLLYQLSYTLNAVQNRRLLGSILFACENSVKKQREYKYFLLDKQ